MLGVSDANDPFGAGNPFQNMGVFGDIAKMLQNQAGMNWDAAGQLALSIATGSPSHSSTRTPFGSVPSSARATRIRTSVARWPRLRRR